MRSGRRLVGTRSSAKAWGTIGKSISGHRKESGQPSAGEVATIDRRAGSQRHGPRTRFRMLKKSNGKAIFVKKLTITTFFYYLCNHDEGAGRD